MYVRLLQGSPNPQSERNAVDVVMQYALHKLSFSMDRIVIYAWSIGTCYDGTEFGWKGDKEPHSLEPYFTADSWFHYDICSQLRVANGPTKTLGLAFSFFSS